MISIALGAALHLSPVVITQKPGAPQARYLRVKMKVTAYGVDGSAVLFVDRQTGKYAEHFAIGPQSFYQGNDGARAWISDINGTTAVQGNAVDRGVILAWGYLFASPRPAAIHGSTVHYADVPQAATVTVDARNRVRKFVLFNGLFNETADFTDYSTLANGIVAPGTILFSDDNGKWEARVAEIDVVKSAAPSAFAPPPRRNDSSIRGDVTTVPFLMASEIIVPVRINDGPVMHFIVDTGGQNVLMASAAKQLGLQTQGRGTVSGAGAGVIPTSFVMVNSVRIGSAEMRSQPFIVLDTPLLKGIDGIVGFEMFSRFAARVDYVSNTLTLASQVPASWIDGVAATPFTFRSRAPAVAGAIDGIPGLLTIDTGNSGVLDVNTPFADENHLWQYYHASKPKVGSLAGVGGGVNSSNVTVHSLHIGTVTLQNVYADLTQARNGIEADPAFAANAGEGVFRNYTFVLDYGNQRLYFVPGGERDRSGVLFERAGNRIVVQKVRTGTATRAGVRPGMALTRVNGKSVGADDLEWVQSALQGQPGSTVDLVFDGVKRVKLVLVNYL